MATSGSMHCGICEVNKRTAFPVIWCPECEEALCDACHTHHNISKGTRSHTTMSINDYRKLPSIILDLNLNCVNHHDKYQYYCPSHDCPMCKQCIASTHKHCKDPVQLHDVVKDSKFSVAFNTVEQNVMHYVKKFGEIKQNRLDYLDSITQQSNNIKLKISQTRQNIIAHLNQMESEILTELTLIKSRSEARVKTGLDKMSSKEKSLSKIQDSFPEIKMYATDIQTFLVTREIEKTLHQEGIYLQSISENGSLDNCEFVCNISKQLENFTLDVKNFGEILIKRTRSNIKLTKHEDKQAQIPTLPESVRKFTTMDLKSKFMVEDSKDIDATGCCIIPDGKLVFCTFEKHTLAVHGKNGSFLYDVNLHDYTAFDVACINDGTVAVTTAYSAMPKILIVDLHIRNIKKTVDTKNYCYGIDYHDGNLLYCVQGKGLYKMDVKKYKSELIYKETFPGNTYATVCKDKILVSYDQIVLCLCLKGKKVGQFQNSDYLKNARGVTTDDQDNIFVASFGTNDILVISPYGKKFSRVQLKSGDKLDKVQALCYDRERRLLVTANEEGEATLLKRHH